MGTNGSFYQNGLPISTDETGIGNVPSGTPVANPANSSFYLDGTTYNTLESADVLLAAITAQQQIATSEAVISLNEANASQASAMVAAAEAAAAAATLASALLKANNLSDLGNLATALVNLGLNNVTNTSDANKPVSTAQATADALVASNAAAATSALSSSTTTALALKAPLASPALTGTPTAPTPTAGDNTTKIPTTAFVTGAVSTLQGTVNTALALKAPLASPALTGTPTAPTAAALDNSTKLSTTAYADAAVSVLSGTLTSSISSLSSSTTTSLALKAPLASPALTGTPTAPTATAGTNTTQLATCAFVLASAAAAGVSSIAGNTGAFTLGAGLTNSGNVISAVPTRTLLNTLTASNSTSLQDTTSFATAGFSSFEIVFDNLIPATSGVTAELLVHSGGAFKTTGYAGQTFVTNSTGIITNSWSTFVPLSNASQVGSVTPGASGTIRIINPAASGTVHVITGTTVYEVSGTCAIAEVGGAWNTAGTIDGFEFLFSSGNITSGNIKVYGLI